MLLGPALISASPFSPATWRSRTRIADCPWRSGTGTWPAGTTSWDRCRSGSLSCRRWGWMDGEGRNGSNRDSKTGAPELRGGGFAQGETYSRTRTRSSESPPPDTKMPLSRSPARGWVNGTRSASFPPRISPAPTGRVLKLLLPVFLNDLALQIVSLCMRSRPSHGAAASPRGAAVRNGAALKETLFLRLSPSSNNYFGAFRYIPHNVIAPEQDPVTWLAGWAPPSGLCASRFPSELRAHCGRLRLGRGRRTRPVRVLSIDPAGRRLAADVAFSLVSSAARRSGAIPA